MSDSDNTDTPNTVSGLEALLIGQGLPTTGILSDLAALTAGAVRNEGFAYGTTGNPAIPQLPERCLTGKTTVRLDLPPGDLAVPAGGRCGWCGV